MDTVTDPYALSRLPVTGYSRPPVNFAAKTVAARENQPRWDVSTRALPTEGAWKFRFTLNGPTGTGTGTGTDELATPRVLEQLGPPMGPSWAISSLPLLALLAFLAFAWRRTRVCLRGAPVARPVGH